MGPWKYQEIFRCCSWKHFFSRCFVYLFHSAEDIAGPPFPNPVPLFKQVGQGLARGPRCRTGTGTHVAGGACAMAMNEAKMAMESLRRETGTDAGEPLATGTGEWGRGGTAARAKDLHWWLTRLGSIPVNALDFSGLSKPTLFWKERKVSCMQLSLTSNKWRYPD